MSRAGDRTAGGLASAVAVALRHLGVRRSRSWVRSRLAGHPQPQSLLALVERAPELGLETRACRPALADLGEVPLPAILHFKTAGHSGFATLLSVDGGRWSVASGSDVRRVLETAELAAIWSGVAVLLAPNGMPAAAGWSDGLRRTAEGFERWITALERKAHGLDRVAGIAVPGSAAGRLGAEARMAASLLGAGLAVAALVEAWRDRGATGVALAVLAAFTALGFALSAALFRISRAAVSEATDGWAARLCGAGGRGDCDSVLHGPWASVGRWSWASLGLAWFGSGLLLIACAGIAREAAAGIAAWLAVAYLAAQPLALLLVAVQLFVLRKTCGLCMAVHGVLAAGAIAGGWGLSAEGGDPGLAGLARVGAVHGLLFLLVLGVFLPWELAVSDLRAVRADAARARATPLGRLAMAAGAPVEVAGPAASPLTFGRPEAPLHVEAHAHPLCPSCGPVVEELLALVGHCEERVRLQLHLVPKSATGAADRELRIALAATALLAGPMTGMDAYRAVGEAAESWRDVVAKSGAAAAVRSLLARAEIGHGDGEGARIERALAEAAEIARQTERAAARLRVGVPAVFVNGRYFGADAAGLAVLVREHFGMVATSLKA